MATKKQKLLDRLKLKYKLVILNDETFEEKASFTLNRLNVFILSSVLLVVLIAIVTSLFIFTPLKEYIPGYADVSLRRDITEMSLKVDSLESLLVYNDKYIKNIKDVINGTVGKDDTINSNSKPQLIDTTFRIGAKPEEDSMLRLMIENQNQYGFNVAEPVQKPTGIAAYSFFTPVKGIITEKYNPKKSHYGIDVAATKSEPIKVVLEGTVVFSGWTSETGYVIAVQHSNDLLSIYKHCSVVLKKVGNFVRSAEPIAIVGDTGEYSTGPHLHFELWFKGNAVNPRNTMLQMKMLSTVVSI
jgi:murein DD-endopeptidase MepM/ murein hydrolase activator NlpD